MTLEDIKEKLLEKIADEIDGQKGPQPMADYYANVYSVLCHADTQNKMTEASIHGPNPFNGPLGDME